MELDNCGPEDTDSRRSKRSNRKRSSGNTDPVGVSEVGGVAGVESEHGGAADPDRTEDPPKPADTPRPVERAHNRCLHCNRFVETRWVGPAGSSQLETMHVTAIGGSVSGDGKCQMSPLKRFKEAIQERHVIRTNTVHIKSEGHIVSDGKTSFNLCGAVGGKQTSDSGQVTCKNCLRTETKFKEMEEMSATETQKRGSLKPKVKAAKPAAARREKKVIKPHPCGCGCMEVLETAGSFKPGHDSRLHGYIKKMADGRLKLKELPKQVAKGMYSGASDNEKGVKPVTKEADYLAALKGE